MGLFSSAITYRIYEDFISMSTDKDKNTDKWLESGWIKALRDAESEISTAVSRISQLRESVRIIKGKIKAGEPWPGTGPQSNAHDSKQQYSV